MYIPDELLDRFLTEDVPYFDLTTHLLDIGGQEGVIGYVTREEAVATKTRRVVELVRGVSPPPACSPPGPSTSA